jgi:hypothetical protein
MEYDQAVPDDGTMNQKVDRHYYYYSSTALCLVLAASSVS